MHSRFSRNDTRASRLFAHWPGHSGRGLRWRLISLAAMLVLVLLAMREAGKLETWEQLGFAPSPSSTVDSPIEQDSDHSIEDWRSPRQADSRQVDSSSKQRMFDTFWVQQFRAADRRELELLAFILTAHRRSERLSPDFVSRAFNFINQIEKAQAEYLASQPPLTHDEQHLLADSTAALAEFVREGKSLKNPETIRVIDEQFDRYIFQQVKDRTALGRSAETLAWKRCWEWASNADPNGHWPKVSFVQLMGQPDVYRGRPIQVEGYVRGAQTISLGARHDLDFDHYFVLWVKPIESGYAPYCIYAKTLPEQFPKPQDQFLQMHDPVSIQGVFFKLRSYTANNGQVETCPLIVAETIGWQPTPTASVVTTTWTPPVWLLALFFLTMPCLAAWLARLAYRSTKTLPNRISPHTQVAIDHALGEMVHDPSILSDRQRVQKLQSRADEST